MLGSNLSSFTASLDCGGYTIGARVLSNDEWSAIRSMTFSTCKVTLATIIVGPDSVKEGETRVYRVFATFTDGGMEELTADYSFSADYGEFTGNNYTAPQNNILNDNRQATITATKNGEPPATKAVSILDNTSVSLVSLAIEGPDEVSEGQTADYTIIGTYSNGTTTDFTSDYVFTCPDGTFLNGSFLAFKNNVVNDSHQSTIVALRGGIQQLSKQITIKDKTVYTSIAITGPDNVDEGSSNDYYVIGKLGDGSSDDITEQYTFNCTMGTFTGSTLTIPENNIPNDSGNAVITATKAGSTPLTKSIIIKDRTSVVVPAMWVEDPSQSYCETKIVEQTVIRKFASPTSPIVSANNELFYVDPTLDGVIYFDPRSLTDGSLANIISMGKGSRPTGSYYHPPSNRLYVNGFFNGGLTVIDCIAKTNVTTINYGENKAYSRGNVYYIASLNEIWAVGNTGFLRINAHTDETIINTGFTAQGSVYVTEVNNKIYVFFDKNGNMVKVYDTSLNLLKTISGLLSDVFIGGDYVSRAYYSDLPNKKIYVGESSKAGGIIVVDAVSDILSKRVGLDKEGKNYASPTVIGFHPLRNSIYIGGAIQDTADAPLARLWAFDAASETITQTTSPSINSSIDGLIYYPPNNSVYASSSGRVPESVPNNNQFTDGIIFKFN
ncbi:YncE family protein [Mucilaginibacter sp. OAE612]|uniref:YncE family protein n=1 Tax=Mucilaginibacter sp. OAE612 TaxID=3156444 RepID=UPI0035A05F7D